jgi:N-acetylglutamate synthase-like GNAT family acetyltransferase
MAPRLPDGVHLRPATAADAGRIDRLLARTGLPSLDGTAEPGDVIVAARSHDLIGTIRLQRLGDDALIRSACVDPDWRGVGLGANLVERALTMAALDAVGSVYLVTADGNRYFARFGFIEVPPDALPMVMTRAVARVEAAAAPKGMPMRLRLAER